jgi:hypothetical protein
MPERGPPCERVGERMSGPRAVTRVGCGWFHPWACAPCVCVLLFCAHMHVCAWCYACGWVCGWCLCGRAGGILARYLLPACLPACGRAGAHAYVRSWLQMHPSCLPLCECARVIGPGRQLTHAPLSPCAVGQQRREETQEATRQRAIQAAAASAARAAQQESKEGEPAEADADVPARKRKGAKGTPAADGAEAPSGVKSGWTSYSTVVVPAAQMVEPTQWLFGQERAYVLVGIVV